MNLFNPINDSLLTYFDYESNIFQEVQPEDMFEQLDPIDILSDDPPEEEPFRFEFWQQFPPCERFDAPSPQSEPCSSSSSTSPLSSYPTPASRLSSNPPSVESSVPAPGKKRKGFPYPTKYAAYLYGMQLMSSGSIPKIYDESLLSEKARSLLHTVRETETVVKISRISSKTYAITTNSLLDLTHYSFIRKGQTGLNDFVDGNRQTGAHAMWWRKSLTPFNITTLLRGNEVIRKFTFPRHIASYINNYLEDTPKALLIIRSIFERTLRILLSRDDLHKSLNQGFPSKQTNFYTAIPFDIALKNAAQSVIDEFSLSPAPVTLPIGSFDDTTLSDSSSESNPSVSKSKKVKKPINDKVTAYYVYNVATRLYALTLMYTGKFPEYHPSYVNDEDWARLQSDFHSQQHIHPLGDGNLNRSGNFFWFVDLDTKLEYIYHNIITYGLGGSITIPEDARPDDERFQSRQIRWWRTSPTFGPTKWKINRAFEHRIQRGISLPDEIMSNPLFRQLDNRTAMAALGKFFRDILENLIGHNLLQEVEKKGFGLRRRAIKAVYPYEECLKIATEAFIKNLRTGQ